MRICESINFMKLFYQVAISSTNNFSDRSASHSMDPKVVSVNELRTENGHSIFDSPSTVI